LKHVKIFIFVVLLIRVLLAAFGPYELAGDEAHYWEWSQRPALSYYTKGPGVAWSILLSTEVFGNTVFGIKFPAILCFALLQWWTCQASIRLSPQTESACWFGAAVPILLPGIFASGQFMTTDITSIAFAMGAAVAAHDAIVQLGTPSSRMLPWLRLGLWAGIAVLFKYLAIVVPAACVLFTLIRWSKWRWTAQDRLGAGLSAVVGTICTLPILIWNAQRDWPTLSHQLGHLGAEGGDAKISSGWQPVWTVEYVLGQLLLVLGPPAAIALWKARRLGSESIFLASGAILPLMFFVTSFSSDVEANWPLTGWALLAPMLGVALAKWRAAGTNYGLRQHVMRWGLTSALIVSFAPYLAHHERAAMWFKRVTGHQERAQTVAEWQEKTQATHVIAAKYQDASLLAFYLPNRPTLVYCASHHMGRRRSPYDYFPDTDLTCKSLVGQDLLLYRGSLEAWNRTIKCDEVKILQDEPRIFLAKNWLGLKGKYQQSEDRGIQKSR
jgi:hypothetical protein